MKTKIKCVILAYVLFMLVFYCFIAFIKMSFNAFLWPEPVRFLYIFLGSMISIMASMAFNEIE